MLAERYVAGLCLTAAGVVAGARDLTATYIKGRTQFGRSLAEFQAVAMQIADVYISSRTLDLAAENAAWRLDQGLDVSDDLAVAAYWTCTEGPPALRTCHHLHGGMGVDETYPLHHYFSWVTDLTHLLDVRAEAVPVEDPTTKNLELTARRSARSRPRCATTSPAWPASTTSTARWACDRHGRATSAWSGRWARTAGWASAGRRSTAATGSARSSRRSSPTRRSTPTCTCPRSPCRRSARR